MWPTWEYGDEGIKGVKKGAAYILAILCVELLPTFL